MALAPRKAVVGFVVGAVELGIGTAMLGWVLLANVSIESGYAVARWVLQHSPIEVPGSPEQLAEIAIESNALMGTGIVGAVIICLGIESVWLAWDNLRPAIQVRKGRLRLELDAPARLGQWLEGKVLLPSRAQAGDAYDVRLGCSRKFTEYSESDDLEGGRQAYPRTDVKYDQRVHLKAELTAKGLAVPFRFEIPAGMPAHGSGHQVASRQFQWKLEVGRPDALFPTRFPVDVRPLAAGDVGTLIGESVPDAPARNWTYVEPTPKEARARAFADRVTGTVNVGTVMLVAGALSVVYILFGFGRTLLASVFGQR